MSQAGLRYDECFARLAEHNQGAFIPFVTIGDPNAEQSLRIIKTLIDNGADALELGIPFSDPSADGITIQMAGNRALKANVNTETCFGILAKVRAYSEKTPIGLLLYANLVFAYGLDAFYQKLSDIGVDSVLLADVPIRESRPFVAAAEKYGIAQIFIAPPNADDATLKKVAQLSKGYTYVLSRAGVTGTEVAAAMPSDQLLARLADYGAPAPVLGFGISTPEHVKAAITSGAKGAISGSATVKIIEQHLEQPEFMLKHLAEFVQRLKAATIS
ncbi:tryptophan synthase subunit alpha [Thalassotalea mangrovi]|uniref:Tryptophan synthase alpha chain n=1 Tax=Thalassotalea mangrovi TaxID=2572245 RepID=A0A4U1B4M3_9GAMM|nr:tryptophan synthase subunit alpha [Thalassotalea mangrovi]TKB45137.1 tryptophan synthase subunit alpha [Thalassotalea mangrovi]